MKHYMLKNIEGYLALDLYIRFTPDKWKAQIFTDDDIKPHFLEEYNATIVGCGHAPARLVEVDMVEK